MVDEIRLETERLVMVVPTPERAKAMASYQAHNHDHFAASGPARAPEFFEASYWDATLRSVKADVEAGRILSLVLLRRGDDRGERIIGHIAFTNIVRGPFLACFLGYGIDRDHEGQGYMFEALQRAVGYVFDELRLHRIMANHMPTNERSGRLLRRLGFVVEGYARDYLFLNGAWRDHVLTSLTNPSPVP